MPSSRDDDLSRLALEALSDHVTMDQLMRRVRDVSHRYCAARLASYAGGSQLADDAAQEICIAVFEALPTFRHSGVPFEAFVYTIASRKVADVQRTAIRSPLVLVAETPELADLAASPEQRAVRVAEVAEMTRILELLPPRLREVLILRVAMGLTAERVGDTLDLSAGAVRIAQHRGLRRLRSLLDERSRTLAVAAR